MKKAFLIICAMAFMGVTCGCDMKFDFTYGEVEEAESVTEVSFHVPTMVETMEEETMEAVEATEVEEEELGKSVTISDVPEDFYINPQDYIYFGEFASVEEKYFPGREVLISINENVENFQFFNLDDTKMMSGVYEVSEVLFTKEELFGGDEMVLSVDLGEYTPKVGISYNDKNGETKKFFMLESGEDGSVFLVEF